MVIEAPAMQQARLVHVLLVDEEVVIRAAMRTLIDSWQIARVVGEADGLESALEAIDMVKPDVIIYSHAVRLNGFVEGLRVLIEAAGTTPVLLITGSRDRRLGLMALQAGVKWIVLKKQTATELQKALERVQAGEWNDHLTVTTRVAQIYRHHLVGKRSDPDQSLTGREKEVAVLVSQGCSNRQVGLQLGITEVTVRHHLTSIFNKLDIANRFELIAWLYRHGIVTPRQIS